MTDIRIENDGGGWDLALVDGDLELLPDVEGEDDGEVVAQRVVFAYMTWLGESAYETTAGVAYIGGVFGEAPAPGIGALLLQIALDVEGVADIDGDPSFNLDSGRTLTIDDMTIVTVNGYRVDINASLTP